MVKEKKYGRKFVQLGIMVFAISGLILLKTYFAVSEKHPDYTLLKQATNLTQEWFDIVTIQKQKLGIISDSKSQVKNSGMLGDDYTKLTTTLGSLEAKELTTNPDYSAVILKMILESGIDSTSTIGLSISGSFPALAIATLAAAQTLKLKVVLFSSLGASSYGANQPEATWIDIEKWLHDYGNLKYKTNLLTLGADNDRGEGMLEDDDSIFYAAVKRSGYKLYMPASLEEAIDYKTNMMLENKISLFINIGGNHSAIGGCAHAVTLPNGLNNARKICDDKDRGIICRLSEKNIPFIHLLNIKDLSHKNGIPLEPGIDYGDSSSVYYSAAINKTAVLALIIILLLSLTYYRTKFIN